jgi:hypothetical protein
VGPIRLSSPRVRTLIDVDLELERAIRASWSQRTCDPVDLPDWSAHNPARGQCASTALVIQDHLGGELLLADVLRADGSRQGVHFWNQLPGGQEVDLTREQFIDGETIQTSHVVQRAPDTSVGRLAAQYRALSDLVRTTLADNDVA